jgi:hypothetical protein
MSTGYPRKPPNNRIWIADRAPRKSVWLSKDARTRIVVTGYAETPLRVLVRLHPWLTGVVPPDEFFDGTWKRSFVAGRAEVAP